MTFVEVIAKKEIDAPKVVFSKAFRSDFFLPRLPDETLQALKPFLKVHQFFLKKIEFVFNFVGFYRSPRANLSSRAEDGFRKISYNWSSSIWLGISRPGGKHF